MYIFFNWYTAGPVFTVEITLGLFDCLLWLDVPNCVQPHSFQWLGWQKDPWGLMLRNSRLLTFRGVLPCQKPPSVPKTPWYFHLQFFVQELWRLHSNSPSSSVGGGGKKRTEIQTDWACSVSLYKRDQQRELLGHMTNGQGECVHAGRRRGKKEEQSVRDSLSFPQWRPSENKGQVWCSKAGHL